MTFYYFLSHITEQNYYFDREKVKIFLYSYVVQPESTFLEKERKLLFASKLPENGEASSIICLLSVFSYGLLLVQQARLIKIARTFDPTPHPSWVYPAQIVLIRD